MFVQEEDPGNVKMRSKAKDGRELPGGQEVTEGIAEKCYCITSEQLCFLDLKNQSPAVKSTLTSSLKSERHRDTNPDGKVNRQHISEFFHYEENAEGIDDVGSDLPMYQWDWDAK